MPRPRQVLHLIPTLYDRHGLLIGGAERYALELARHMASVVPTTLVSFGDNDEEREENGLRIRLIAGSWHVRGQVQNPVHAAVLGEIRNADIVHCHQTHVLGTSLAALVCRLTGKRVFTTDLGGGGWDVSAYFSTDSWFHGHLHISEYSRAVYGHEGSPRAQVILGGVDMQRFSPGRTAPTRAAVVFAGRLLPHKGVDDLIRAMPEDLALEVIGRAHDPSYFEHLRSLAEGKRVAFHHDWGDDKLIDAYRSAVCVVLPSVYRTSTGLETRVPELLGQTLLEGMACGTPGIGTHVGSLPEVVDDGRTGFIVPPGDPRALRDRIEALRRDPERIERMGAAARRWVLKRFTWPAVVERCLAAYERPAPRADAPQAAVRS